MKTPVMTFSNKKTINTVLFIDRMATFYVRDTVISVGMISSGAILTSKRCGNERQGVNLTKIEFNGELF